ncbi:methyltransferase family protein [Wenzhouxiangella sediminis]|uniref:methyltransferase family protein n=1 Tax=Wenzhouxiangella sediminis TaxID=1792836 RepID=UPI001FECEE3E|nr:isoprenylcysteine carboxylmethyltransferase family protein [Wenzhouxiangella sediminis]
MALVASAMWGVARMTIGLDPAPWLRIGLAALLLITGAWLAVAGVIEFRRASTTVNPMAPGDSSTVVDSGVYRYTRNPMYLGFVFVLLAWAVWLAAPWTLLGPAAFVAWMNRFQILPEERALVDRFGDDYRAYRERVRRWV